MAKGRKRFKDLMYKDLMYFVHKNGDMFTHRFYSRIPQVKTTDEILVFFDDKFIFKECFLMKEREWNCVNIEKKGVMITPSRNEAIEISNKIKYDLKFKK
jgi:hypothetical protein